MFNKESKALIGKIVVLLKPYTPKIAMVLICIFASSGISMLLPQFSKQIMDNGLIARDFNIVVRFSLLTLLFVLLDRGIGLLETRYFSYINSVFQYSLLKKAFKHILKLKLQYFNNTNFAEIMNNVDMDVGNISRICDRGTFMIISQTFRILGGAVGLLIIDWRLTILVVLICPAKYVSVRYLTRKRKQMFEKFLEYNRDFFAWYGDAIGGVREIKLWGVDRIKTGQFIKKQRDIVKTNIKMNFLDKINECSESILFQIILNSLYILGAYMVFSNDLSIGGLFAFLTYSTFVTGPISAIINIGYNFSNVIPSAKRFFEFLDMETEADVKRIKPVRISRGQIKGRITFDSVAFSYKEDRWALKNVSFEINPGEKVAIIGANGSGKSTLVNLLLRIHKPDSGKILMDGIDINDIKLRDYRSLFSVVSQDLYLFNTTIEENISVESKIGAPRIHKAAKESGAQDFIEAMPLKYKTDVGRNGAKLSGGQRQKLAVARAFAKDAKILVLDEATSNYDAESEIDINNALESLSDKTVILISHRLNIVTRVDRVIFINDGEIIDIGTHNELYGSNKIYRRIIDKRQKNGERLVV
jgi:ATP-binding cassette subfamily B protein